VTRIRGWRFTLFLMPCFVWAGGEDSDVHDMRSSVSSVKKTNAYRRSQVHRPSRYHPPKNIPNFEVFEKPILKNFSEDFPWIQEEDEVALHGNLAHLHAMAPSQGHMQEKIMGLGVSIKSHGGDLEDFRECVHYLAAAQHIEDYRARKNFIHEQLRAVGGAVFTLSLKTHRISKNDFSFETLWNHGRELQISHHMVSSALPRLVGAMIHLCRKVGDQEAPLLLDSLLNITPLREHYEFFAGSLYEENRFYDIYFSYPLKARDLAGGQSAYALRMTQALDALHGRKNNLRNLNNMMSRDHFRLVKK